jgi:hypothetical protein
MKPLLMLLALSVSAEDFVSKGGFMEARLTLRSPGADWALAGKEAAIARVELDGQLHQHIILWAGPTAHEYRLHLGEVPAGTHQLRVVAEGTMPLLLQQASFRDVQGEEAELFRHAPVLHLREDTIGKFSDVPLMLYVEKIADDGLQYSVIFSNEDGGTSTRALMARWGRATDIEHLYLVWPAQSRSEIQTRDHADVPFKGPWLGQQPLLLPITRNNMVAGGENSFRLRLAPLLKQGLVREAMMDLQPAIWQVMRKELQREDKLKLADPQRYLYVDLNAEQTDSRLALRVRMKGSKRWLSSHLGIQGMAVERSGWMRIALELPIAAKASDVAEIAAECLSEKGANDAKCFVSELQQAFLLRSNGTPDRSLLQSLQPRLTLAAGEMAPLWSASSPRASHVSAGSR